MGKLFTPANLNSGFNTTNTLNTNFTAIEDALDNCLARDGSAPNTMSASLDLNSNDIINGATANFSKLLIDGQEVPNLQDVQDLRDEAENWATYSQGYATTAESHRDKAKQWAEEDEDTEVETGEYSAYHWAQKAANSATHSTARVELGGDFDPGSELICERVGNTVTLVSDGYSHSDSSNADSAGDAVPTGFRPSSTHSFVGAITQYYVQTILITELGMIQIHYRDWTGALYTLSPNAQTFTITYLVSDSIT